MACILDDEYSKGDEVKITKNRSGIIRYRGPVDGKQGEFFGIELTRGNGKHCGIFQGKRYFTCTQNRGVFVKQSQIRGKVTSGSLSTGSIIRHPSHGRNGSSLCLMPSVVDEVFEGFSFSPNGKLSTDSLKCPSQNSADSPKSNGRSGKWKPPKWMHKAQPSTSSFLNEKISNRGKMIERHYSRSKSNSRDYSPQRSRKHCTVRSMDGQFDSRRYELDNLRSQALYYEQQLHRFQEERRRYIRTECMR